jgi:hypothetical protein
MMLFAKDDPPLTIDVFAWAETGVVETSPTVRTVAVMMATQLRTFEIDEVVMY